MIDLIETQASWPREAAAAVACAERPDSFEQPVPRKYVHRAAVAEVLITGFAADTVPDNFLLAAQWPRGHSFYRPACGFHDPLLFAETIRQTALMTCHAGYGAPFGTVTIMRDVNYRIDAKALVRGDTPTNLIIMLRCADVVRRRGGALVGYRGTVELRCGTVTVGTGSGEIQCVSAAVYQRMRPAVLPAQRGAAAPSAPVLAPPVAPALVGKQSAEDVVLTPGDGEHRWWLRCDTGHPVLFDHPVDHVPGMVLIEAMRQAVQCAAYPRRVMLTSLTSHFERFVELGQPAEVRAFVEPGGHGVRVEIAQNGSVAAVGHCGVTAVD